MLLLRKRLLDEAFCVGPIERLDWPIVLFDHIFEVDPTRRGAFASPVEPAFEPERNVSDYTIEKGPKAAGAALIHVLESPSTSQELEKDLLNGVILVVPLPRALPTGGQ